MSASAYADWSALADLQANGARVTASLVDLDSGKVVEQLNADTRLTPASLTKLVVAAAALAIWPTDKTFATRLLSSAPIRDGLLQGDLILHSNLDSTLDHQALWSLAAQLKGAGISNVRGDLVVSTAPFGPLGCETKDRCEALDRSATAYNAPIAAIGVDYGNWCIDVRPLVVGSAAILNGCGGMALPIPVQGSITTVAAGQRSTIWLERFTTPEAGDVLRVGGNLAVGEPQSVYRAMSEPARGTGMLLRETLRAVGIQVAGTVTVSHLPLPANAIELAHSDGLSLKEQLGRMLRFSNNYIADMLTLNLAAATGRSTGPLADAARSLSEFVSRSSKRGKSSPPPLFSGSGLTPENLISAEELTSLLAAEYRDTRNFPAFYGGLVVPRQAPFAFLRGGSPGWQDRIALKTGTMNDPHSVCGIAGYVRKQDGGWMSFALIVNGGPRQRIVPLYKCMEAARKDLDGILTRY